MRTTISHRTKEIAANAYLYGVFMLIIFLYSQDVRVAVKPLSFFVVLFFNLIYWIVYVILNHTIMRRFIPVRRLVIVETILFLTMVTLFSSDVALENRM